MKIEVLGSGCPNCRKLAENAMLASQELNLGAQIVKVTDYGSIAAYGVMRTPALVVDGKVLVYGRVPSKDEIKKLLGR
ncbi:MAG TPA: thioredoxin family protein [Candidatus Bilamarchaeum sp.]|nr:thioredoxin family protein [Candidatus Bilamarchaeum sp.]